MAATLSGFDTALASYYTSDRVEAALFSRPPAPRQRHAASHECANCGAPWRDEHQADTGPCFYCHARRPGEVAPPLSGPGMRALLDATSATKPSPEAAANARRAQEAMMLANARLQAKQSELAARQSKLDAAVLVGTRSGMSHRGATGLLRRMLGLV